MNMNNTKHIIAPYYTLSLNTKSSLQTNKSNKKHAKIMLSIIRAN